MATAALVWCGILTLALIAHMFKDASEFRRIRRLEEELQRLRK